MIRPKKATEGFDQVAEAAPEVMRLLKVLKGEMTGKAIQAKLAGRTKRTSAGAISSRRFRKTLDAHTAKRRLEDAYRNSEEAEAILKFLGK